jgi:hypothetical protein
MGLFRPSFEVSRQHKDGSCGSNGANTLTVSHASEQQRAASRTIHWRSREFSGIGSTLWTMKGPRGLERQISAMKGAG